PFISQTTTWPVVPFHQRMSLLQSPLKSWVAVGGGTNTHAAPAPLLSPEPPTRAALQDNATERPWLALPTAPVPTSLAPCWLHVPLLRVNSHAAPASLLSDTPPTIAALPFADRATETP